MNAEETRKYEEAFIKRSSQSRSSSLCVSSEKGVKSKQEPVILYSSMDMNNPRPMSEINVYEVWRKRGWI